MTTELEKQFFETFGINGEYYYNCDLIDTIEPDEKFMLPNCSKSELISFCKEKEYYSYCKVVKVYKNYPQITDHILLKLICIINQADLDLYGENDYFMALNYKDLKEEVIAKCKRLADKNAFSEVTGEHIKHQVQELFKGE